nr:hypothetical protein [Mycobacterium tuberculosis]
MPSGEPSTAGHFEHLPRGSFGRILSVLNAAADHHPRELLVVGIATFDQKRPAVGVDEHDPGGAATPAGVINYESRSSAGGTIGHSTTSQVAGCLYQQPKRPALRPTKAAATTAATTWIERVQNRRGRHSALV